MLRPTHHHTNTGSVETVHGPPSPHARERSPTCGEQAFGRVVQCRCRESQPTYAKAGEMAGDPVERQFHKDMVRTYERAKDEAGYVATRFIQLVSEKGGLAAARQLLHGGPSDGFTALWEKGRLDLSVGSTGVESRLRGVVLRRGPSRRPTAVARLRVHGPVGHPGSIPRCCG